ncbi:MAG: hypothetical protein E5Y79_19140 [Mesorhizobium sp.]|nr:MAG: hypothetical protein E5Y79_19140 [Mesorhizobium sp.]
MPFGTVVLHHPTPVRLPLRTFIPRSHVGHAERPSRTKVERIVSRNRRLGQTSIGRHHILLMPSDLYGAAEEKAVVPDVFELQIKTLFQHAWSEAEHDLGYKPGEQPLDPEDERLLAFTSAQAWGADRIFDDLFKKRST